MTWYRCGAGGNTGTVGTLTIDHNYNSLSASDTRVRTIWTKTVANDEQIGLHGMAYTDTSRNEGKYVLYLNDIAIDECYLTYNSNSAFGFDVISVNAGDIIDIKTDWDGSHTGCRWTMDLFIAEVT